MGISSQSISVRSSVNLSDINIDSDLDLGTNKIITPSIVLNSKTITKIPNFSYNLEQLKYYNSIYDYEDITEYTTTAWALTHTITMPTIETLTYRLLINYWQYCSYTSSTSQVAMTLNGTNPAVAVFTNNKSNAGYYQNQHDLSLVLSTGDILRFYHRNASGGSYTSKIKFLSLSVIKV